MPKDNDTMNADAPPGHVCSNDQLCGTAARHTPGPWRWELNAKSKQVELCGGKNPHDLIVMDFVRWGMGGAAPRLREDRDELNIMHRCERWAEPVVGHEHHASWFQTVNHPDMNLIAAAPDLLEACMAAMRIADLWSPVTGDHDEECAALYAMRQKFESAIAKALGE